MLTEDDGARGDGTVRRCRRLLVAACAGLLMVGVTACGEDSSDSGGGTSAGTDGGAETASGVAEAEELLREAEKPVQFEPPGEPFDTSGLGGKKIWYISYSQSIPYEVRLTDGLAEAAESVGAEATAFDGKFDVTQYGRGLEQAVQANADVIILGGIEPKLVAPGIKAAKKAGIPVIATDTQDPGAVQPPHEGVVATATHSYSIPAKMEAQFVVADSKGEAKVIFLKSSDLGNISDISEKAFTEEMARLCSECEVEVVDVPGAQWDQLTTKTASLLRRNPDVNYYVPFLDGMVPLSIPGVTSAGAGDRVKIVSFNASDAPMAELAKGNIVAADVGNPNVLQGWGVADQAFRVIAGEEPVDDIGMPFRIFTERNIDDIDLDAPESEWYGVGDFESDYKQLWGVQ